MENNCVTLEEQTDHKRGLTRSQGQAVKFFSPDGNDHEAGQAYNLGRQLKDALATEMQEYCGLLALLSASPNQGGPGHTILHAMAHLEKQLQALASARQQREFFQTELARYLDRPDDEPLTALIPQAPAPFRLALSLLLRQNQRLLQQVQQYMQANINLVSRWMESIQSLRQTLQGWNTIPESNLVAAEG